MQDSFPTVSVVVPCRNEREHIEKCIRSLWTQKTPAGGFEIIVVDGMSDDGTREILTRLAMEDPRVRVIDNPMRTTPYGMNAGIRIARGSYIAIMGAHNRYAPDYLYCSLEVLAETGADNVGGAMMCEANAAIQRAIAVSHHSPFCVGGAKWHNVNYEGPADTVFGGVYRREVFERIGLFDEELVRNQDDEFNLRLNRAGGTIWQSPRIKSWYSPRNSLSALFRQYLQYGYWKVRVIQKHRLPASVRHLIPGAFVFCLLAMPLASIYWPLAMWFWMVMVAAYLLASTAASALASSRSSWRLFPVLPAVFACYHIAYGVGFLRGLVDFVLLRRSANRASTPLTRS
jgi:succinoglycan biosynthesis protein ExoA